jgi:NAD dependent epimerase/dehydratase family enzyme
MGGERDSGWFLDAKGHGNIVLLQILCFLVLVGGGLFSGREWLCWYMIQDMLRSVIS